MHIQTLVYSLTCVSYNNYNNLCVKSVIQREIMCAYVYTHMYICMYVCVYRTNTKQMG